ncbi:MAG: LytTR family DNA-binding domain-containing protein [Cellulosilyticaceae bacterium]
MSEEILYFKSDRRKVQALTTKGEYDFYGKLDEIEESLVDKGFMRCHQRYLVNRVFVD